jgi:hypothetical protein
MNSEEIIQKMKDCESRIEKYLTMGFLPLVELYQKKYETLRIELNEAELKL